ncbi:MAG: 3'-5' exonuclease [Polyangiaceae bacterium]|nr:3'-5' exonuclease [Polyangiaceae bacterium]
MRGAQDLGCFPTGRHYPGIAHLLKVVAAGLAEEWPAEHVLSELPVVCIDTETTGRDPNADRIVEIACVRWQSGAVVARHGWLINPGIPIPKEAFDVHGISDADVAEAKSFAGVALEVVEAMRGAVPMAYNAEFDRRFVLAELSRAEAHGVDLPPACRSGVEWIDPLVWVRELQKFEKGKSLGDVCLRLGIEIGTAHRATDDAEATLAVFERLRKDTRVPTAYGAFVQEQRRLARLHDEERARWRASRG